MRKPHKRMFKCLYGTFQRNYYVFEVQFAKSQTQFTADLVLVLHKKGCAIIWFRFGIPNSSISNILHLFLIVARVCVETALQTHCHIETIVWVKLHATELILWLKVTRNLKCLHIDLKTFTADMHLFRWTNRTLQDMGLEKYPESNKTANIIYVGHQHSETWLSLFPFIS